MVDSTIPIYEYILVGDLVFHVSNFNASFCSIIKETPALELLNELVKNIGSFIMSSFDYKNAVRCMCVLISPLLLSLFLC